MTLTFAIENDAWPMLGSGRSRHRSEQNPA